MTDIEQPHRTAYDHGTDPIDWAVQMIVNHMEVQQDVLTARAQDPSAFPNVRFDLDNASVARRALATLLDAGWTPPQLDRPDPTKEATP